MKTYCLVCRKSTANVHSKMIRTKNGRLQLRSQRSICANKKRRFVKEHIKYWVKYFALNFKR